MRTLDDAHVRHTAAVAAYAAHAQTIAHNKWMRSPAEKKWSPAAITTHLMLSFQAFDQELGGGAPMQMRIKGLKRAIVRLFVMRRILRDGHFPSGAPAPRETRPPAELAPQPECIRRFQEAAAKLDASIARAHAEQPNVMLTHPYFGRIALIEAVFISARHIEHHMKQL